MLGTKKTDPLPGPSFCCVFLLWFYADAEVEVAGSDGGGDGFDCAVTSDGLAVGPGGWPRGKKLGRGLDAIIDASFGLEGEGDVSSGLADVDELRRGACGW